MVIALHTGAKGLGKSKVFDPAKRGAALGAKQGVVAPCIGAFGIHRLGNDVVVPCHQRGFFAFQKRLRAGVQTFHPAQFVIVFRTRSGVAVGQVKPANADRFFANYCGLDPAGFFVVDTFATSTLRVGQAAHHIFKREFRQDRHAVEPFLPVGFNIISHVFKDFSGEPFVDGLDFLQQRHIRLRGFKPIGQRANARFNTVDIERCDFHMWPLWLGHF